MKEYCSSPMPIPFFRGDPYKILLFILLDTIVVGLTKIHNQDMFRGRNDIFGIRTVAWALLSDVALDSVIPHCAYLNLDDAQNWTRGCLSWTCYSGYLTSEHQTMMNFSRTLHPLFFFI